MIGGFLERHPSEKYSHLLDIFPKIEVKISSKKHETEIYGNLPQNRGENKKS